MINYKRLTEIDKEIEECEKTIEWLENFHSHNAEITLKQIDWGIDFSKKSAPIVVFRQAEGTPELFCNITKDYFNKEIKRKKEGLEKEKKYLLTDKWYKQDLVRYFLYIIFLISIICFFYVVKSYEDKENIKFEILKKSYEKNTE